METKRERERDRETEKESNTRYNGPFRSGKINCLIRDLVEVLIVTFIE